MSGTEEAVEVLRDGGVVLYPTETVYGLGADALSSDAVERVFEIKERRRSKPVSVAFGDTETVREYTTPSDGAVSMIEDLLPGPVTVLVPKTDTIPDVVTAGSEVVGIRIPDHDVALEIVDEFGPITSTSANISGEPSAAGFEDVDPRILERVDAAVDGGRAKYELGSTVVDTRDWGIVREGAMCDEVEDWIESNV
ncbi:MAG: L-threonylcarbamoyladenylate synthase [Halobacteria archaeon]|nr:L-threonylcarbamoyladenylate synthase [Halobacteria archaeon]